MKKQTLTILTDVEIAQIAGGVPPGFEYGYEYCGHFGQIITVYINPITFETFEERSAVGQCAREGHDPGTVLLP